MTTYLVTRHFINGLLEGGEYTEETSVHYEKGFICKKPCGGSSGYEIISVMEIGEGASFELWVPDGVTDWND